MRFTYDKNQTEFEETNLEKDTRNLGSIKRTFNNKSGFIIIKLFTTLVRPLLEYENVPRIDSHDMDHVEKVHEFLPRHLRPTLGGGTGKDEFAFNAI